MRGLNHCIAMEFKKGTNLNLNKLIITFFLLLDLCNLIHGNPEKPHNPKRSSDFDSFEFGKPATGPSDSNVIFEYGNFKTTMQLRNSPEYMTIYDKKLKAAEETKTNILEYEVSAKTAVVSIEAKKIFDVLEKCGDKNADIFDALAIDNLIFNHSKHLNYYLQKAKHDIQEIIYTENGEYIGIRNYEDANKIKNIIANLNNKFNEWKCETNLIKKDLEQEKSQESSYPQSPYRGDLKTLINSNLFTQTALGVFKLCECGNFEQAKAIRDQFKKERDKTEQTERKKLSLNHSAERRFAELDYIISRYELLKELKISPDNGLKILQYYENRYRDRWCENDTVKRVHYAKLVQLWAAKLKEFKASSITSQTINDPIFAQNIIDQLTKMPQLLATNMQLLEQEKKYWYEFKSEQRYETRLKSWQESIKERKFTAQNYALTAETTRLFQELDLDDKAFTKCYGNQFQQALHKEFVDVANKAGLLHLQSAKEDIKGLAKEIAAFSDLGSNYLKAGFVLKATYTADFCWALLDCGIAITEGTIRGLKNTGEHLVHPIETATKLGQAIFDAGYHLTQLLGTLVDDIYISFTNPAESATRLDQRIERTMALVQAIENKLKNMPPRDVAKKSAEIITEGWLEGKLLSIFGKFCSSSKKFYENITKMTSAEKVAVTAEGLPIPFQIAEEITKNNFLKKNIVSFSETEQNITQLNKLNVVASKSPEIIIKHPVVDSKRIGSALKKDPYHAFSNIIDNHAQHAKAFNLIDHATKTNQGLTKTLYQIEGSLNGVDGIFEWIVENYTNQNSVVSHRYFIKNGKVTGIPNLHTWKK